MAIRCEHVHRLELCKSFKFWAAVQLASVPKAPFISYSRISYFGHACPNLNLVLDSRLTGIIYAQNKIKKNLSNSNPWTC